MTVAVAILVIAILISANSKKFGKPIFANSMRGLTAVIIAIIGGVLFTFFGADNLFSYVMAIGFVGALVVYALMMNILGREHPHR